MMFLISVTLFDTKIDYFEKLKGFFKFEVAFL